MTAPYIPDDAQNRLMALLRGMSSRQPRQPITTTAPQLDPFTRIKARTALGMDNASQRPSAEQMLAAAITGAGHDIGKFAVNALQSEMPGGQGGEMLAYDPRQGREQLHMQPQLPGLPSAGEVGGMALGAALPLVFKRNPRGIFDFDAPKIQGTMPSDARLLPPQALPDSRMQPSMLSEAIANSPIVREGMMADIDKGMTMGGPEWYELGPLKADLDARTPNGFRNWNTFGSSHSQSRSVPAELSNQTVSAYANKRGISTEQAKKEFLDITGYDKLPSLMESHRTLGTQAQQAGVNLPADVTSESWKIPSYANMRGGGGGNMDINAPGWMPALDTHERRRLMQLAMQDPDIAPLVNQGWLGNQISNKRAQEMALENPDIAKQLRKGFTGHEIPETVPIANAQDYATLAQMYTDFARQKGLPTAGAAQAARWTGGWDKTGLISPPVGDFMSILEDAVKWSAQQRGMPDNPAGLRDYWSKIAAGDEFILPWAEHKPFPIKP